MSYSIVNIKEIGICLFLLTFFISSETLLANPPSKSPDYNTDIQPILSKKCFACHGPADQESELALHQRSLAIKKTASGKIAIVTGHPDKSELIKRITSTDEDVKMPPEGDSLTEKEIQTLKLWIKSGAPYATHWSFVKPVDTKHPEVKNSHLINNKIDQFILARLNQEGIKPSPTTDRATLLRRITIDITGLLPTVKERNSFLEDKSDDAYEKVVDRLLNSEHFGERWGRHWLDLARYADTFGYERDDVRPNAWRYRDWVINSFNNNQPYDHFIIEQLAGDLLPKSNISQKIAAGLHRMNIKNMESGINKEDYRNREIIDRLNTTGTALLGLTIGCCQCHSHKYDPISQKDYYQLYAFFNNTITEDIDIKGSPEEQKRYQDALSKYNAKRALLLTRQNTLNGMNKQGTLKKWYVSVKNTNKNIHRVSEILTKAISSSPEQWTQGITQNDAKIIGFSKEILSILKIEPYKRSEEQLTLLKKEFSNLPKYLIGLKKKIKQPEEQIASLDIDSNTNNVLIKMLAVQSDKQNELVIQFWKSIKRRIDDTGKALRQQSVEKRHLPKPQVMTLIENKKKRRETFVLARGDFKQKTEKVQPNTPVALNAFKSRQDTPDRLDFAKWITTKENPLTARVAVNHIWKHLFGSGIVSTMDDFGAQGTLPSHPELLDWLAIRFMDYGWNRKTIIKTILMSKTYQQSSVNRSELNSIDPQNRLLARQSRFRVESEIVRDLFLDASGLIHHKIGGPSIHPDIPQAMRDQGYKYKTRWVLSDKPERYRRGLYIHFKRTNPYPSLIMFDNPEGNVCTAERNRSNTPLQSLVTLNDPVFVECALALGEKLLQNSISHKQNQIRAVLEFASITALSRNFNHAELKVLTNLYNNELTWYQTHKQEAIDFLGPDYAKEKSPARLAAWVSVARTILNLDEFTTRE